MQQQEEVISLRNKQLQQCQWVSGGSSLYRYDYENKIKVTSEWQPTESLDNHLSDSMKQTNKNPSFTNDNGNKNIPSYSNPNNIKVDSRKDNISSLQNKNKNTNEHSNNHNPISTVIQHTRDGMFMAVHTTVSSFLQMKKQNNNSSGGSNGNDKQKSDSTAKSSLRRRRRKDDEYNHHDNNQSNDKKSISSIKRKRCNENNRNNNLETIVNQDEKQKKSRIMSSKPSLPQSQENHHYSTTTNINPITPLIKQPKNVFSKKKETARDNTTFTEKTVQFSDTKKGHDFIQFYYFDKNKTTLSSMTEEESQNQNNSNIMDIPLTMKYLQRTTDPQNNHFHSKPTITSNFPTSPKNRFKENTVQPLSAKLRKRSRHLLEQGQKIQSLVAAASRDEYDTDDIGHAAKRRRNYGFPDHNGRYSSSHFSLQTKGKEIAYKKILNRHRKAEERIWKKMNEFPQKEELGFKTTKEITITNGHTAPILNGAATGDKSSMAKMNPKLLLDDGNVVKTNPGEQKDTVFTFGTTPKIEKNTNQNSTEANNSTNTIKASTNNVVFSFGNESDAKNENSKTLPTSKNGVTPSLNGAEKTDQSTSVGFTFNTEKSSTITQSNIPPNGKSTIESASKSTAPVFSFGQTSSSNNITESTTSNRLPNSFDFTKNNGTTIAKKQNVVNSNGSSASTFTFGKSNEKIEPALSSYPSNGIPLVANSSQPSGGFSLGSKGPRARRKIGTSRRRR